jgi:hypothetical protein
MATPLINPLRISGGTMYAFSSAVRDMQKSLMDNDIVFSFSKFALIDLPDANLPTGGTSSYENKIVWKAVSGYDPYSNSDLNIAESFENYLLNNENIVLTKTDSNGDSYDNTILQSVSERLFWKWLTKLNAIKFEDGSYPETAFQTILFSYELVPPVGRFASGKSIKANFEKLNTISLSIRDFCISLTADEKAYIVPPEILNGFIKGVAINFKFYYFK